ncbi:MAG TPA: 30S ribosome-binding factor RbfA, partial [Anaerolineales bacterium]|nr:30S ribosome-binding factor RbfA [Anaerolineales bacterium]
IASLISNGMRDDRLNLVTVTHVNVDRELEHANVWVCAPSLGEDRSEQVLSALTGAAGFVRHELASRLKLRRIPQLHFHWDFTPDKAAQIEKIIDGISVSHEDVHGNRNS